MESQKHRGEQEIRGRCLAAQKAGAIRLYVSIEGAATRRSKLHNY
jgi:hypothetical protein